MTERQKVEGAAAVHMEETRVRMMVAIGQAPPLDDAAMLAHLRKYALEVRLVWSFAGMCHSEHHICGSFVAVP
jgi:hypothetical protein